MSVTLFYPDFAGDWSIPSGPEPTHVNRGGRGGLAARTVIQPTFTATPDAPTHMNRAQLQAKINHFAAIRAQQAHAAAVARSNAGMQFAGYLPGALRVGTLIGVGLLLALEEIRTRVSVSRNRATDDGAEFVQIPGESAQDFADRVNAFLFEDVVDVPSLQLGSELSTLKPFEVAGFGHRYLSIDVLSQGPYSRSSRNGAFSSFPTGSEAQSVS